jgi:predicted AlkP superfamily phosphohydrolase/phosphomutase
MRFLRMLTNSLIAGALGAAFLTIIVVQLNPDVPLASVTPWQWFVTLGLFYGAIIAAGCYVMIVAREFFAMDVMSPGWASVRVLAWLSAALSAAAAVLMWLNVRGFAQALGEEAARRMTAGAVATTASALVLLVIAVLHYSFGRRGSRVGASLFVLAVVASLVLPVVARGAGNDPAPPPVAWRSQSFRTAGAAEGPRVTLIALDGASLDFIMPRAAEGRLPNFSRVIEGGAAIDLATIRPTQPDSVWAAVATGMYPGKNGVRSAARHYVRNDRRGIDLLPDHCFSRALVRTGLVRDEPRTSDQWLARPLWSVLSDAGLSTGIVRWPLTHPAQPSLGFIVSDRFHQAAHAGTPLERTVYPPEIVDGLRAAGTFSIASGESSIEFLTRTPEAAVHERDLLYARVARTLHADRRPRLMAVRYEGLDVVGHHYLRYTHPPAPRGVPERRRRRFADVIERYYAMIDTELGAAVDAMQPGDLVIVVSGFGMHQTSPLKQALSRVLRDADLSGTHERAPDGFLLAYGNAVQHGRPQRGSIVDVTPTLLYFFGLPVALDMDGFARSDLFTREFSTERPITFIPSYR